MIRRDFLIEREHGRIRGRGLSPDGPPARTAVVLVHGFLGSADGGFFPWLAEALVGAGHAVVAWTCVGSGFGASGRRTALDAVASSTHSRELEDLVQVVDLARRGGCLPRRPEALALVGHGSGGAHALLHAARDPGVDALVTWSAPAELLRFRRSTLEVWRQDGRVWVPDPETARPIPVDLGRLTDLEVHASRLDPLRAAARLDRPWLLVHGRRDAAVDEDEARRLADACPHARLVVVDGDHRFGAAEPFAGPTPALIEALAATRAHLARHLGRGRVHGHVPAAGDRGPEERG